ncbi:hypothetical protein HRV97_16585 [Sphingomonas sp. HHU CXW]|uniref:Uncharacterized protein n=1 Tax=Sphingomonas hominis TaxID=2741495 RepID=A0ABX2JSK2_9SPHN|nr:hypothetical protein [Sphingomonas hominis]NTS66760.1 hypothetical protein [Sphingomonas hominis]
MIAEGSRQAPIPPARALPQVEQIAPALPVPALTETEQPQTSDDAAVAQLPPEPRVVRQPRPSPKTPPPTSSVEIERAYVTVFGALDARPAPNTPPVLDAATQGYLAARIAAAAGVAVTDADVHPSTAPVTTPLPKAPKP